ncbi:MAG: serine--tRNA ligase, partial [Alphaproteobacteria bacterium]|nr:serine--tRNA ligase [Alphaproteobacteria bacterium]
MIDPKIIRETPDILDRAMARRHQPPLAATLTKLDEAYRFTQTSLQNLQKERNDLSAKIGELKKSGGNADALMARMSQLKIETATMDDVANKDKEKYHNALALVPNIPADDVPDGKDEKDNKEIARWGDEYQRAPANPKQHFELGEATGEMDFNLGAKLSGARFTVLKKNLARLERALANFMLDVHTQQNGYTEISPPLMVNEHIMFGTGQLPKFADDQFVTRQNMWLIPTAEVPLTNFVNDEIVDEAQLPLRLTAKTPC